MSKFTEYIGSQYGKRISPEVVPHKSMYSDDTGIYNWRSTQLSIDDMDLVR